MDEPVASVESKEFSTSYNEPKAALTPPTSEEWNKDAGADSDNLSELGFDEDDEQPIEPDHYYGGGRVPVFKPTMDQFRDFQKFIHKVDKYGMKSGIVKVIPPKEWRDNLPALDEAIKSIRVKNPITQEFAGSHGTYTQANIEKQRSYNLPQWKSLTEETQHQPPARRGEKRKHQEKASKPAVRARAEPKTNPDGTPGKRRPGRPPKNKPAPPPITVKVEQVQDAENIQAPPTPTSPVPASALIPEQVATPTPKRRGRPPKNPAAKVKAEGGTEERTATKEKSGGRQPRSMTISERRKYNRQEKVEEIDEAAFQDFDYRFDAEEFTAERCAELEEKYWKSVTFAPPMYGADMPGSLFDDTTTSWNVAKLPNILDIIGQKVPGVNTAYLYLGMWKATFAWHLEDVDLYSINYIHFGAPKQWYSISQEDARRFENAMKSIWPSDAKNCGQFLRHKTYLISPALLKSQFNIEVNKLVHYEGEFVITYPYGYHSGYNLGYNCAESVNFATENWLDFGRIAKKCDCEADSVWINVDDIERKLRGEPTPEYYEATDDEDDMGEGVTNLPSPPASVSARKGKPGRKRKRDTGAAHVPEERKIKKIKIRIRTSNVEPCVLCPNSLPTEPLLRTDTGRFAHRVCALYTPETYLVEENGVETVVGVGNIDRARLDLKCSFCRLKKGACFQCSSRKCTRAFHATCAAPGGVQVEYGPTPVYGENGTEYVSDGYDFRCRFHRPKRAKNVTIDALEANALIRRFAKSLQGKETVQAQYLWGEVFAGTVVENRPSERSVILDILPDGDRIEVEWKFLTVLDPADSQLPRPTADAKPLPAHMMGPLPASRNLEFGPPIEGDQFSDASSIHKWAEFNTAPAPHNPFQMKVDLDKTSQIWFYLFKRSTDTKAQFTEDPDKKKYNPAGNFLETVRPATTILAPAPRKSLPAPRQTNDSQQARNIVMPLPRKQSVPDISPYEYKPYQYKPREGALVGSSQYSPYTPDTSAPSVPHRASFSGTQVTPIPRWTPPSLHKATTTGSTYQAPQISLAQLSPSVSAHSAQSSTAPIAPLTSSTAATVSSNSQPSPSWAEQSRDYEFVKRIQPYRYLVNSYCRRPKVYRSPYAADGGYSPEYEKVLRKDTTIEQQFPKSVYQECSIPLATYKPALAAIQKHLPQTSSPLAATPMRSLLATQMMQQPQFGPAHQHTRPKTNVPYTQGMSTFGEYSTSAQFQEQIRMGQQEHQMKESASYDRLLAQIADSAKRMPSGEENYASYVGRTSGSETKSFGMGSGFGGVTR